MASPYEPEVGQSGAENTKLPSGDVSKDLALNLGHTGFATLLDLSANPSKQGTPEETSSSSEYVSDSATTYDDVSEDRKSPDLHALSDVPVDRQENVAGGEPCIFPNLAGSNQVASDVQVVYVPLEAAKSIDGFCKSNNVALADVAKALWALTLHQYVQHDGLIFAHHQRYSATKVVQVILKQHIALRDVVKGCVHEDTTDRQPDLIDPQSFNTFVGTNRAIPAVDGFAETTEDFNRIAMDFDVGLGLIQTEAALHGKLWFRSHILSPKQASLLACVVSRIFSHILQNPDDLVSDLKPVEEKDFSLLWHVNEPTTVHSTVQQLIIKHTTALPDRPAIFSTDREMTYQQFHDYSDRLAEGLISMGVKEKGFVPFCMEKSAWAVIAMIGILKSGATFVPLDPTYPANRMVDIIQSTGARVILTSNDAKQTIEQLDGVDAVVVNDSCPLLKVPNQRKKLPSVAIENLAYVLFTSGSTGKPKGVMVSHQTVCSSMTAHAKVMRIGKETRAFQFAAFTFDASICEILTVLSHGGCVCLPSESEKMNDIPGFINRARINWAFFTPAVMKLLKPSSVPTLKHVVVGGELLPPTLFTTWFGHLEKLWEAYGPTETCVYCSVAEVKSPDQSVSKIGHTIGSRGFVVDSQDHNKLVPVGCTGELLIEGPIVTSGYLNNDTQTQDAFISDLLWAREASHQPRRMYKTGDLVYQTQDGSLNYVRRKDAQVKINGQRMELGEVEQVLAVDDKVARAVAAAPSTGVWAKRLCCVVSLNTLAAPETTSVLSSQIGPFRVLHGANDSKLAPVFQELRGAVAKNLPSYMVPKYWLLVEDIPLSTSGKINRRQIGDLLENLDEDLAQKLSGLTSDSEPQYSSSSPLETTLRLVWSGVLNVHESKIGDQNDFFGLGGDSISAMQVVSRCRKENICITVQDILECKTVSGLALRAKPLDEVSYSTTQWGEETIGKPFKLSPIQTMHFRSMPEGVNHYNQSFMLKLTKDVDSESVKAALDAVVGRHSMLRARFQKNDRGKWHQHISPDVRTSYRYRMRRVNDLDEALTYCNASQKSLNIREGPLIAVDFFEISDGELCLFLVAHHLVIDFVSWRILFKDIEEFMIHGCLQGPPPVAFSKWASEQRLYGQKHLPPQKLLPFDASPAAYDYWGMEGQDNLQKDMVAQRFCLNKDITDLLLGQSNNVLRTRPREMMMGAILHSFSKVFADRPLPALFTEGHGREPWSPEIDVSDTIGWFTHIFPVQIETSVSLKDAARRVKDMNRRIPDKGWSYFTSRYMNADGIKAFAGHEKIELSFDYLGMYQQLERSDALMKHIPLTAEQHYLSDISEDAPRITLVEITASIHDGEMSFDFEYNKNMQHQNKIIQWAQECNTMLQSGLQELSMTHTELTLSDIPLLNIQYSELEILSRRLEPILKHFKTDLRNVEAIYPCSPMQEGILVGKAKAQDHYNVQWIVQISDRSSNIDFQRLASAWQAVVERHTLLRTAFLEAVNSENLFYQVVLQSVEASISKGGPSDLATIQALGAPERFAHDLPYSMTCYDAEDGSAYLRLDVHHALLDGSSMPLLMKEIKASYEETMSPDPGPSYSDFIDYIQKRPADNDMRYWLDLLDNLDPCSFPDLSEDTEVPRLGNLEVPFQGEKIRHFCRKHGCTVANIIQLVWAVTIWRYTDAEDVCFGYLVSGRDAPIAGAHEMIGPMINMMVCRMQINRNTPIMDLLEQVQSQFTSSLAHQHVSLGKLQQNLGLKGQALFNTTVNVQRLPIDGGEDSNIRVQEVGGRDPSEYDISLNLEDRGDAETMVAVMSYWTSRLSDGQAANLASTFTHLVDAIISEPHRSISELNFVSPAHMAQIEHWNSENLPPSNDCIHDLVVRQVKLQPDRIAVQSSSLSLTYRELDELSLKIASNLSVKGVRSETIVAHCFDKSPYTVAIMLGILKAGGVCLGLDPSQPRAHLKKIIEETGAKFVVTQQKYSDIFDELSANVEDPMKIISMTRRSLEELSHDPDHTPTATKASNMAFVTFTSDWSGDPRAVALQHDSMATSIYHQSISQRLNNSTRTFQSGNSLHIDSILEIFCTLSVGGCLCLPSVDEQEQDLSASIRGLDANTVYLTPALTRSIDPIDVSGVETLVIRGDAQPLHVNKWTSKRVNVIQSYDHTECSGTCASFEPLLFTANRRSLGKASGAKFWVVEPNDHNKLVPLGARGELLIEGPLLARGYLNEESTRSKFVSDPEWTRNNADGEKILSWRPRRLFKTGDMVRANSDGTLQFVGRKSARLSRRGQEFNLDELERRLTEFDDKVRHAMVVVPKDGLLSEELCLVFSLTQAATELGHKARLSVLGPQYSDMATEQISQLRKSAESQLPAHMVPSKWIVVEQVPLNTSGMLDRSQAQTWLQGLNGSACQQIEDLCCTKEETSQPGNDMESRLQKIWARVLSLPLEKVGLEKSFVSLGGDSISAMQIISGCKNDGILVTMQHIMRCKTIVQLALHAKFADNRETGIDNQDGNHGTLFDLSPIQNWYFNTIAEDSHYYHQSFLLKLTRLVSEVSVKQGLGEIVRKHPMLRARFSNQEGRWQQSIAPPASDSYKFETVTAQNMTHITFLCAQSKAAIDIRNGPIFAALLISLGDKQLLFLAAHHLVIDLVSWRVIYDELEGHLEGRSVINENFGFRSWDQHLRRSVDQSRSEFVLPTKALSLNAGYWGLSQASNLCSQAYEQKFTLDEHTTSLLLGDANKAYRTDPVELMMAAALHSFGQTFTDRSLPAVFSEGHGREASSDIDLSRTVGWFTIMSPIQVGVFDPSDLSKTVVNVKDTRRRIPNKGSDYFAFRYNHPTGRDVFGEDDTMEILFNYHGLYQQFEREDALFQEVDDVELPSDASPNMRRSALFEINAAVSKGQFTVTLEYSDKSLHQNQIQNWIRRYHSTLQDCIPQLASQHSQYTPSDFPLAGLDLAGLQHLLYEKLGLDEHKTIQIEDIYPCTSMQEGILVGRMKQAGHYDVQWVGEFKPPTTSETIDVEQLRRAWQAVVDRHQILRTIFVDDVSDSGLFLQVVLANTKAKIATVDQQAFDEEVDWNEHGESDNLSTRIQHQVTLCQTSQGSVLFRLEISHALLDGTSTSIIIRELNQAYRNLLPRTPAPLYSDFIAHLQSLPQDETFAFWSQFLEGSKPCHFPRWVSEDALNSPSHSKTLKAITSGAKIHDFCSTHGLTISNLLQLVWGRVLQVFVGMEDVSFGCLSSGRDVPIENMHEAAGPSINMMVCRPQISARESVLENLSRIQERWTESLSYQHASLAHVQHRLQLGGSKLFNTVLNLQRGASDEQQSGELLVETITDYDPSEYDISLDVEDFNGRLDLILSHWTSCINTSHAENILSTVVALIERLVEQSQSSLGKIPTCSDTHRLQMDRWNSIEPTTIDTCIHHILQRQAFLTPDRVAIHSTERSFTYRELDNLSTPLACKLLQLGAGPGIKIPFCFDKSPWTIVAMLSILKSGSAYVALDPTFPPDRRQAILNTIKANIVLCQAPQASLFNGTIDHIVVIDEQTVTPSSFTLPDEYPSKVSPSDPAIIQFTSGSTGKPKGIVLEHRNISTSMYHNGNLNLVSVDTRSLQFASYTFDISTNEIWGVLGRGGCVCVPTEEERKEDLTGVINRLGVNWLDIPPAVASIIDPAEVPRIETLVLGGEAISKDIINQWVHHAKIIGSYGPAEASVACGGLQIMTSENMAGVLGRPSGSRLWVVDPEDYNVLLPIGCTGELLIEGPLVAREYLQEPGKTANSFVQNPAWAKTAMPPEKANKWLGRMYRSGDLARFESDGMLTYLGRTDDQVKLHGYRIELGDIEHHILKGGSVKHAIVSIPESGPWKQRLITVLSLKELSADYDRERALRPATAGDKAATDRCVSEINDYNVSQLPHYMVPSHYIVVEDLPLNASGKIDRRRVAAWLCDMSHEMQQELLQFSEDDTATKENDEPRTEMEASLRSIWSIVLDMPENQIGLEQSFLSLGGDSVSAMKIIGQCKANSIETTIQDVFTSRTIRQLALKCKFLANKRATVDGSQSYVQTLEVTPAQEVFLQDYSHIDRPSMHSSLLELAQITQPELVRSAIQCLLELHPILGARFEDIDGKWMQHLTELGRRTFYFDTATAQDLDDASALAQNLWQQLDLTKGNIVAALLININDESQLIYIVAHKAAVDPDSWEIVLGDLDQILTGEVPETDDVTAFAPWVHDQNKHQAQAERALHIPVADEGTSNEPLETKPIQRISEFSLDKPTTTLLLGKAGGALQTRPSELIATSILQSFRSVFFGQPPPSIHIEETEREPVDRLPRAVGNFSEVSHPQVDLSTADQDKVVALLSQVKDSRRHPASYKTSSPTTGERTPQKSMQIVLRYTHVRHEAAPKNFQLRTDRPALLQSRSTFSAPQTTDLRIDAKVNDGQLCVSFSQPEDSAQIIEVNLLTRLCEMICTKIVSQLAAMERTFTLSDFPRTDLTKEALQHFSATMLPKLGILPTNVEDLLVCSPMQQGMLLSATKDNAMYKNEFIEEAIATKQRSLIDPDRLDMAWRSVVQRHQILRTVFVEHPSQDGSVAQLVLKDHAPHIRRVHYDDLVDFEQSDESVSHGTNVPPHCLTICETSDEKIFLKLDVTHALTDGVSKAILFRELSAAYEGKLDTRQAPLYSSFIAHLRSQPQAESIEYWTKSLRALEPCHFPSLRHDEPAEMTTCDLSVPFAKSSELRAFCAQYEVTLSHFFQALWAFVLQAYIGTDDVCFGYLASGRDLPLEDVDEIVGPMINMLICRLQLDQSRSLVSFVQQVRDENIGRTPYQHCPMGEVYHNLHLGSKQPFNTIVTVLRDLDDQRKDTGSIGFVDVAGRGATEYGLVLDIHDTGSDVEVVLTYSTDILSGEHAHILAEVTSQAFNSLLETPEKSLQSLDLTGSLQLGEFERLNQTIPQQISTCMHESVYQYALKSPTNPAICSAAGNLTYAELDDLSTRLAHHLVALGIKPNDSVPFIMEKGPWTIVAMLAIMKAGGAFVPLDPSHPRQRHKDILGRFEAPMILVSPQYSLKVEDLATKSLIAVCDGSMLKTLDSPVNKIPPANDPSRTAYILFTSGSTGKPKGVVVPHHTICSSMAAHAHAMDITSSTRTFQFASYTFDAAICEIFTVLQKGGCICVPTEQERLNDVANSMERMKVNWAFFTPTVIKLIQPSQIPSLKTLVLGGEMVKEETLRPWEGRVNLMNGYGPTETCVFAITGKTSLQRPRGRVGYPVGCRIWVVSPNDHDRLAPLGALGELLIEGPTVAAGYLDNKKQTEAAFISSPVWHQQHLNVYKNGNGISFYKTGDLGRSNLDGSFTVQGRKDSQSKINGQRLELGEIEKQIQSVLPKVEVCVQILSLDGLRDILVAALVCPSESYAKDEIDPSQLVIENPPSKFLEYVKDLERTLPARLPSFMIPSCYLPVTEIPTTVSGKSDRRALKSAIAQLPVARLLRNKKIGSHEKKDAISEVLQKLWADVLLLNADEIAAESNFFGLGGDSITAMKLVSRAHLEGLSLTVSDIFKYPVFSELSYLVIPEADVADSKISEFSLLSAETDIDALVKKASLACNVRPESIQDIYPCTPLQEGLVALSASRPGSYINQQVERIPASVDLPRLQAAWDVVYGECEILRTRITHDARNNALQVVVDSQMTWKEVADLHEYLDADRAIPIGYGDPLVRFAIAGSSAPGGEHYLIMTAHHASYDAWSMQLILNRVTQVYLEHEIEPVAPFKSFVQHIAKNDIGTSKSFWTESLDGAAAISWPSRPTSSYQPLCDATIALDIAIERQESSEFTLSTVMRAAWSVVLGRYASSDDVVFGTTLAGRNAPVPDISTMVGPTIATVPLRVKMRQGSVFDFLQFIQAQNVTMIPHEHTGLQDIRRLSSSCEAACDFQTLLVVQPASSSSQMITEPVDLAGGLEGALTYALTVICELGPDSVRLRAAFDSKCIPVQQVELVLQQMESVIHELCLESRVTKLSDIGMLSAREKALIFQWNRDLPIVPENLILDQIAGITWNGKTLDAIHAWDGSMTYRELDVLSSNLAAHLHHNGIQTGSIVPLMFEKSKWYIVALLAILKTGSSFTPLDPTHPLDRLASVIERTRADTLLSSVACLGRCHELARRCENEVSTIVVDAAACEKKPHTRGTREASISPHTSAYVMFTSGSTGMPKGVIIEHGSITVGLQEQIKVMKQRASSRVLQFANHTFDASILEIFATLMTGGCICIPSDLERLNNITDFVNTAKVNYAILTPSVARMMEPLMVPDLQTLCLAGESWGKDIIDQWGQHARIVNLYGPTETSIAAGMTDVNIDNCQVNNFGRGVGGATWITDAKDSNVLMPIGCTGELLVEGPNLARGYLNDEEKTREAFINAPTWATGYWSNDSRPARFYRTGDLVRYECDGTITFVGRKDSQVKVNGQRLELGEVEHHLNAHSLVQSALVFLPKTGELQNKLTAVVVLKDYTANSDESDQLQGLSEAHRTSARIQCGRARDDLTSHLAEYMIPSAWLLVTSLPLLSSGKTDRKSIQSLIAQASSMDIEDLAALSATQEILEPKTQTEAGIRQVWSDVLNRPVSEISTNTAFGSLGGDSISAMLVVSGCRSRNIAITVRDVLEQRTIASLSTCAKEVKSAPERKFTEIEPGQRFPLTPIQKLWFALSPNGENHFNQSFALRLNMSKNENVLRGAVHKIMERHSMLRARFEQVSGSWSQFIASDIEASFRLRAHHIEHESQITALLEQSQSSLNIQKGPLVSVDLVDCEDSGTTLFVVIHHLVVDLVSWRIILQDLESLLTTEKFNTDKSLAFPIWAQIQEMGLAKVNIQQSHGPFEKSLQSYWGLEGVRNTYDDTMNHRITLDKADTSALMSTANRMRSTEPVDLLLGCLIHSFVNEFADRPAPLVFNEGHGRDIKDQDLDVTRTVGWFTDMAPIGVEATSSTELSQVIKQARDERRNNAGKNTRYLVWSDHDKSDPLGIEILFNYSGLFQQIEKDDGLFTARHDLTALDHNINPAMERFALFDVSIAGSDGALELALTFNQKSQHQDRIERWIHNYVRTLTRACRELPDQVLEPTISDFKMLRDVDNKKLSAFINRAAQEIDVPGNLIEDIILCFPTQQTMLLKQSQSGHKFYSVETIWELRVGHGNVDTECLKSAWQLVVSRSEALRSIFTNQLSEDGAHHQVVLSERKPHFSLITAANAELARKALKSVPVISHSEPHRFTVCIAEDSHRTFCRLDISHAVIDHTSMSLLFSQVQQVYSGVLSLGSAPPYRDFLQHVSSAQSPRSEQYWHEYLATSTPSSFPVHKPLQFESLHTTALPLEHPDRVRAFCEANNVSLFNLLQASWAILLTRYTSAKEVHMGYMVSARDAPVTGATEMIGLMTNVCVCRAHINESDSPVEVVKFMKDDFGGSVEFAYGAAGHVEEFERRKGGELFDTVINYRGSQRGGARGWGGEEGLAFELVEGRDPMHYKIVVSAEDTDEGVGVSVTYWQPCIAEEYAKSIVADLGGILSGIADGGAGSLSDL